MKPSHYLEYAALRVVRAMLMAFPLGFSTALMGKLWRWLAPFNSRHNRVLTHLDWAFGDALSRSKKQAVTRAMWESLGRTFAEGLMIDRITSKPSRFMVEVPAFQEGWCKDADGAIIGTHHFGNWELASAATVLFSDKKLLGIYKRVKNPLAEQFFLDMRQDMYPGGLYSQQNNGAKRALEYVRNGGDMAMVADLRDGRGVPIDFFGMEMKVNPFPAALARKYNRPLYAAQMRRTKGVVFQLDMVEIEVSRTDNLKHDIHITTQRMHKQFENWIREHPEQFMWAPYRWSGRLDATQKPMTFDPSVLEL